MPDETTTTKPTGVNFQCRHIFPDGRRCGSPTLRSPAGHEPFCYYHHTTRRPAPPPDRVPRLRRGAAKAGAHSTFTLPNPGDLSERSGIQLAIGEVLRRIAANEIDPRRAGLLLYGLQIASLNLKNDHRTGEGRRQNDEENHPEAFVTEITLDPDHGPLAPPAELHVHQPLGSAQRLLQELNFPLEELNFPAGDHAGPQPHTTAEPTPQPSAITEQSEPALITTTGNLSIDLHASATSERETIFRMSNFIPKPASPKLSGLGPKAQKLAALREKAAAQANNAAAPTATDSTSAAKPKNSVARKTAFQRKAT